MSELFTAEVLTGLLALTFMEIMLGIDNVIFVSIILDKLKIEKDKKIAKQVWMIAGIITRLGLLFLLGSVIDGTKTLFTIFAHDVTLQQLIMLGGGLFLLVSTTLEIHNKLEGEEEEDKTPTLGTSLSKVIKKIVIVDLVFSFDSIIAAIGMAEHTAVRIIAVVIAMIVMFSFAGKISAFIQKHPTFKMLALSFLILIGFTLIVDGIHVDTIHIPHGYIYFAMGFSFGVELLNLQIRKKSKKTAEH